MAIDPSLCHYLMLMEETHGTFFVFFSPLHGLASFTFTDKIQFNYCIACADSGNKLALGWRHYSLLFMFNRKGRVLQEKKLFSFHI